jgi:hypothetical protein
MIRSSQSPAASLGKKRWVQILGFMAIAILILLEPRIERWLAGQKQSENAQSSASVNESIEVSSGIPMERPSSLGKLKEIRSNVFQSSAGLIYRAGSEDGHRLRHIMQHAKDNPEKKIHGIFDGNGDRNIVLAVIDEAWLIARTGGSDVRSEHQNERRVFTINLRRRIGKLGGEEGKRRNYPECRYLRIVLENEHEVISAYPTRS